MGRELWLYDIASAYPFAMLHLPSMRDGKWIAHTSCPLFRLEGLAGIASQANMLSTFRIKWKFPERAGSASPFDGKIIPFNCFPYRTKRGNILIPSAGHAWIMRDELLAGIKWIRRFFGEGDAAENLITVEEWSEFVPGNDERPYAFVAELYEMRRVAKSQKEYDIVEKAIKLTINRLYGKTVQSVGGTEDAPPSCACPYYSSAVTAHCRARLLEAALIDPYSVVTFMTDGLVTTRELKGLPNAKEVFEGEPPPGVIINIRDWEFERMAGGFFLQSGGLLHRSQKRQDQGQDAGF